MRASVERARELATKPVEMHREQSASCDGRRDAHSARQPRCQRPGPHCSSLYLTTLNDDFAMLMDLQLPFLYPSTIR